MLALMCGCCCDTKKLIRYYQVSVRCLFHISSERGSFSADSFLGLIKYSLPPGRSEDDFSIEVNVSRDGFNYDGVFDDPSFCRYYITKDEVQSSFSGVLEYYDTELNALFNRFNSKFSNISDVSLIITNKNGKECSYNDFISAVISWVQFLKDKVSYFSNFMGYDDYDFVDFFYFNLYEK